MSIAINDRIVLRGHVKIIEQSDLNSKILLDEDNLIVFSGRNALLASMAGISEIGITGVHFGTSGTVSGNASTPITPIPDDLDAYGPIAGLVEGDGFDYTFSKTVTNGVGNVSPKIVFSITIPKGVTNLNYKNLNSMALMMSNGSAFSVKNFGTITKNLEVSLVILWSIYV